MLTPRSHTPNITKLATQELGWEIIKHAPYSPELSPSDFHLFRSSNNFRGISSNYDVVLQNWFGEFFTFKPRDFFRLVKKLPRQWRRICSWLVNVFYFFISSCISFIKKKSILNSIKTLRIYAQLKGLCRILPQVVEVKINWFTLSCLSTEVDNNEDTGR